MTAPAEVPADTSLTEPTRVDSSTPAEHYNAESVAAGKTPPERMDHHERMRLRAAAYRAEIVYPGPIGELVFRDLLAWDEFGFRFGGGRLIAGVVHEIMTARMPGAA